MLQSNYNIDNLSSCISEFSSFAYREAMSKPTGRDTMEFFQNDLEPVSEASTSSAHLTDLEHHTDVCEWTVSG